MSAFFARDSYEHKENLSKPPTSRVVCLYPAFIVLIWPQPPLSHILSHRSSHCSCQSLHRLISATLFVSIPSLSHLSLSKSSATGFVMRHLIIILSFAGRLSSEVAHDAAMLLIGVQPVNRFSYRFGVR